MTGPARAPVGWGLRVTEHEGGVALLEVRGEIDAVTVEPLADAVRALTHADQAVVLDLTRVTYLGSRGLALFIEADAEARRRRGRFVVVPGPGDRAVSRALALTGVDRVLDVRAGAPQEVTQAARAASPRS
ncbi:STAS domain-containing protein [Pseudonocardia pini]|uniref:STAS domain-containing protein n=1 Tax=Pseudonocardia pini TaxID=2758030 RepID=UPI0028B1C5EE|nr:STAS domain-containing protein [Pseudonocardia pini]